MAQLLLVATILLLVFVGCVSADIMGFAFWQSNKFAVDGRTVLLTGSSQGMGKEIARLLSARGANLILVARTVKNLEAAVEHAKAHAKNPARQRFTYIAADVTSETENERILAEATGWNNGRAPDVVWAVAGSSTPGLFVETRVSTLKQQMKLNYFAAALLAHKTLQSWWYPSTPYTKDAAAEPARHFIFTASGAAFCGLAGYNPYAPAKAALRSLADGLRSEAQLYNAARRSKTTGGTPPAPFDVDIHIVFPGTILSPGFENEEKTKHPVTKELESSDPKQSELEAATAAVRGLESGHFMITTNPIIKLLRWGQLGNSQKNNVVLDMVGVWVSSLVWLFMVPDLNGKVWGWGTKNGMPNFQKNAQ